MDRLESLEAKVAILFEHVPKMNQKAQNESQDRLEGKLPLTKNHYGPANEKKDGDGEWRPKKASRLIPLTLLM